MLSSSGGSTAEGVGIKVENGAQASEAGSVWWERHLGEMEGRFKCLKNDSSKVNQRQGQTILFKRL